jgi:hypothetical protein
MSDMVGLIPHPYAQVASLVVRYWKVSKNLKITEFKVKVKINRAAFIWKQPVIMIAERLLMLAAVAMPNQIDN